MLLGWLAWLRFLPSARVLVEAASAALVAAFL
jgi:hypothetical protein